MFGKIGILEFLLFMALILVVILWIIALVDIIRSRFKRKGIKAVWFLVVIVFPVAGALIYFFIGKKEKIDEGETHRIV